jgi:uncharacterized membrane protein YfcA
VGCIAAHFFRIEKTPVENLVTGGMIMQRKYTFHIALAGAVAGALNGLFGAGGGMILVPLLTKQQKLKEDEIFPASISIILPICLVSLIFTAMGEGVDYRTSLPYLMGSAAGGVLAGTVGRRVPTLWLHRIFGVLLLWGGVRYLW